MSTTPEDALVAANNFVEVAQRLLALAVEFLNAADADGSPDRSYLSAGTPPWDLGSCGQLVLYPTIVTPGYPGIGLGGRPDPSPNIGRTYYLTLELARCVPTIADGKAAPKLADLQAAGERQVKDYRLLDLFVASLGPNSKLSDQLLRVYGVQAVAPGQIVAVQPQGGMAAVRVTFAVVT